MSFPTPYTVGYHARTNHGPDRFRDQPTYSPPKDQPGTPVAVIQWSAAKAVSSGGQLMGHDRLVSEVDLFAPPGFDPQPGDLIDLPAGPAGQFEVAELPRDYTHGFHGWQPGTVIPLRRVEG